MSEEKENPYKGISEQKIKEAVEYVFRKREKTIDNWIENLNPQQKETLDKIIKAEIQDQLEKRIKFSKALNKKDGGKANPSILDETGQYSVEPKDAWWNNPESETFKEWTKVRKEMNKKNKKYKQ